MFRVAVFATLLVLCTLYYSALLRCGGGSLMFECFNLIGPRFSNLLLRSAPSWTVARQSDSGGQVRTKINRKPPSLQIPNRNLHPTQNQPPSRRVPSPRAHAPPPQSDLLQPPQRSQSPNLSTASSRQLLKVRDGLRRSSKLSAPPLGVRHRRQR